MIFGITQNRASKILACKYNLSQKFVKCVIRQVIHKCAEVFLAPPSTRIMDRGIVSFNLLVHFTDRPRI